MIKIDNLFSVPGQSGEEIFKILISSETFKLEQIISYNHASPEGFWYEQEKGEWVILLRGSACLKFDEPVEIYNLKEGDYCLIPAGKRHRVEWTDENQPTFWLALHF